MIPEKIQRVVKYLGISTICVIIALILSVVLDTKKSLNMHVTNTATAAAEAEASATAYNTNIFFNMYSANVNSENVVIERYASTDELRAGMMKMPPEAWPVCKVTVKSYLFGFINRWYLIYPEFTTMETQVYGNKVKR